MYLHIGNGKNVREKEIVGVFDLDTATVSKTGRDFLNKNQKEGRVEYTDSDLPRSFVLTSDGKTTKIRLSRISSLSLCARAREEESLPDMVPVRTNQQKKRMPQSGTEE